MGFSPLGGLMMATRCGSMDPAAVLHLLERTEMSTGELRELLNQRSGLLGVSGQSSDMQALLASDSATAGLAVDMFCHRVRHYVGAYLALLRGADAIILGGGIGEHSAVIRHRVLEGFGWAGIHLDDDLNRSVSPRHGGAIHGPDSRSEIWVIPPDEAQVMAVKAGTLLRHDLPQSTLRPSETAQ